MEKNNPHAIRTDQRLRRPLPHQGRDPLQIMNRPQHIRRMRARHQPCLFAQQALQPPRREPRAERLLLFPFLWGRPPPLHDQGLPLGEVEPRRDVGLVIDGGEDELVARPEDEGGGGVAEELGRGGAEDFGASERMSEHTGWWWLCIWEGCGFR